MAQQTKFRLLPAVTELTEHFWRDGERLRFFRCTHCHYYLHPPAPVCPKCASRSTEIEVVSGRGEIFTYTINHRPIVPGDPVPYVLAIVQLAEQADLKVTTEIVGCAPEAVHVGMPVHVRFEPSGDIFLPLFEPDAD